ncbi:McbB family protein [Treponema pedis]|uniref:McbB family protein n=1 Tax=Treponema pedis TaxID=409322 RepID=A0A7S6WRD2_9SPIR|nr:McbB family protein [Treponema pedis]QOW61890.1 McbB family protein [Treponema pedis]
MKYKLIPYLMYKNDEVTVIQNEKTTCIITDTNLIDFFTSNDENYNLTFTLEDLKERYGDNADSCLDFLLNNSLAVKDEFTPRLINRLYFFTNSKEIASSLKFNLSGLHIPYDIITFDINMVSAELFFNLDKKAVYYVVLNPFNYKQYSLIANYLKENNVIHKFCFYYNYSFYFTNYHKADWHNPCPLCYFSHLEGSLRSQSKLTGNISFQTIIDLIYTKTTYFNTEAILDNFKMICLINEIIEDITALNDYTVKLIKQLNMKTGKTDYDIAIPWEVCPCHE